MASGKKSFVLYCDLMHTFDLLDDASAGKLMKHLLQYVNDMNPETDDILLKVAFEPIKRQLKRDLKDWEETREKRVKSGHQGGVNSGVTRRNKKKEANEASASKTKQGEANEAVTVNVTVTDNVNTNTSAEVGGEKVKQVANEVWKDQHWRDSICMGLSLSPDELKKWLAMFNSSIASDNVPDFDKGKYKKMSRGWIVKQQAKGTTVETNGHKKSDSAPLQLLNHGN